DLPGRGGLRHHAAGGHGRRAPGHRPGAGRGTRDRGAARRRRAADGASVRPADGRGAGRRHRSLRGWGGPLRAEGAPSPRRGLRPPSLPGADPGLSPGQAAGTHPMLKGHSRVFEQLILPSDLVLVAACWLLAYGLRVYAIGPPITGGGVPPLGPYLLLLLPILIVWGVSFRIFDLYRPRRIGSHLSEAADIAKASTLGALVLVAIMTFFFRGYDYSRLVIVYFWLLSIAVVWFSRAAFREVLRFARRRGYNLRYAVVVGDGELAATVVSRLAARTDVGIEVLGVVGDDKEGMGSARRLGGYSDLRAVLDAHAVDHVILALV